MTQERMREICWEIGTMYPVSSTSEYMTFSMIYPRLGYLQWQIRQESVDQLQAEKGHAFHGAALVIRVYDVTDIVFDGLNAHSFFDRGINALRGNYYLTIDRLERNLMAEIGFRLQDNSFHALSRSNTVFFDRDRPSGCFQAGGLFVGRGFTPSFPVENVFDAPVYERMHHEMLTIERQTELSVAVVFLGGVFGTDGHLESLVRRISERCTTFGGNTQCFTAPKHDPSLLDSGDLAQFDAVSNTVFATLKKAHQKTPFDMVHCHDWYSAAVGLHAVRQLKIPMVLSLHSTEYERAQGSINSRISSAICEREHQAIHAAETVIVPHSSTRQQIITVCEADPEKIMIISDMFEDGQQATLPDPGETKRSLGLHPVEPLAMFAGEISHASGADILMEAVIQVCGRHGSAQFVFAGDGPLKGELEGRAWHSGIGHRCRFTGDISREYFESILMAADFVIIPARTWQDEGFAQMALAFGKPILATHQSHINCVMHGQNGLLTYDNTGSIVWGINELLANPLQGNMLRIVARRNANRAQTLESIAVEHFIVYQNLLNTTQGGNHV